MRRSANLLPALLWVLAISTACADDKAGVYMSGGKFKERIEILDVQGGVAGFSGTYYAIAPDGSWRTGPVLPPMENQGEPTTRGKLNDRQLAHLAEALARYDLANLPSHGKPAVNPRVIKIHFGEKVSELQPNPDTSSKEDDQAIRARYDGILRTVKVLCKDPQA